MKALLQSTYFNPSLLAGVIFLCMGFFIRRYPPPTIRTWYGYRSVLSTKNIQMWRAANAHAAYISRRIGAVLVTFGIACALFFDSQTEPFFYTTVGAVIIGMLYMVGYTEWRLAQEFDDDGNEKKA